MNLLKHPGNKDYVNNFENDCSQDCDTAAYDLCQSLTGSNSWDCNFPEIFYMDYIDPTSDHYQGWKDNYSNNMGYMWGLCMKGQIVATAYASLSTGSETAWEPYQDKYEPLMV